MHYVTFLNSRRLFFFIDAAAFLRMRRKRTDDIRVVYSCAIVFMGISKGDILVREGVHHKNLGDYDGAFSKWSQAEIFFREANRKKELVSVYHLLGYACLDINDYEKSLKSFHYAHEISRDIKYQNGVLRSPFGTGECL